MVPRAPTELWYHRRMDNRIASISELMRRQDHIDPAFRAAVIANLKTAADKRKKEQLKADREFARAFTPNKYGEYA